MPEHIEEDVEHEGDGAEVQVGVEPWHSPIIKLKCHFYPSKPLNRNKNFLENC